MNWWYPDTFTSGRTSNIQKSRQATVQVLTQDLASLGTGFFIGANLVLTCFHVAVSSRYLKVRTSVGAVFSAELVSSPAETDLSPRTHDFAYVHVKMPAGAIPSIVEFAHINERFSIGEAVVYSGFPLDTPGMFTAQGVLAGSNDEESLLFVQGPVNKGNSGGALMNISGNVIGIITAREGGISRDLEELQNYIVRANQQGSASLFGVNMLPVICQLISTLDEHISTGIGYATDIKFAREYAERHFHKMPIRPPAST